MQVLYNKKMDEQDFRDNVAEKIRMYRAKLKLSQSKLAEFADTNQQYINQIENGKSTPSSYKLYSIAQALKVTVNDLIY